MEKNEFRVTDLYHLLRFADEHPEKIIIKFECGHSVTLKEYRESDSCPACGGER